MELNVEPFGRYLLYQIAAGVDVCQRRMGNVWKAGDGDSGGIFIPPHGDENRERLCAQVTHLDTIFKSNGIYPLSRQQRNIIDDQFLPES
jgi:hypothetical protein